MEAQYIIDFGSRAIKLHRRTNVGSGLLAVQNWDPIGKPDRSLQLGRAIDLLTRPLPPTAKIYAIGTAAARRRPELANSIFSACAQRGIVYETISQTREARLIRHAFRGTSVYDIINVGGGSIQIVHPHQGQTLLEFGISDLNANFGLAEEPQMRDFLLARKFLRMHIPKSTHAFVYVGGELKYLRSLGARLGAGGRCTRTEFLKIARELETQEVDQMEKNSPFGPGWMAGANASNLVVEICLEQSVSDFFIPSDINIGDGFIAQTMTERGHEKNDRL
jgi:exopolyphosphatase/pppGpp-phosphohydrolase